MAEEEAKKKREQCIEEPELESETVPSNDTTCGRICIYTGLLVCLVGLFLVLGREYITVALLYVDETNRWISTLIFGVLYVIVAFPMTWGYILLNIAAGYIYGAGLGILVVLLCANFGISFAHFTMKTCCRNVVMAQISNPSVRATIKVVDSENGAQIVFLSRLTPIPFGLQNAVYAMSNIGYFKYIGASVAGMLPTQGMHVYLGSTFRSMEEVLSSSGETTPLTYVIFGVQLGMIVVLFTYVIYRARLELARLESGVDILDRKEDVVSAMEKGRNGIVRKNGAVKYEKIARSD